MTKSKRKRVFIETGNPLPGDLVMLKPKHAYRTLPNGKGKILRYSVDGELALILGLDAFLEDALLLSLLTNTLGWYDVQEYQLCP